MPPSSLAELWMRGVAANPAAPPDVLLRLLDPAARAVWKVLCGERALPPEVVDAVVTHPEPAVRRQFARNQRVPATQRGRLVDDPDALVRATLASGPTPRPARIVTLPDDILEALMTAPDDSGQGHIVTAAEIKEELVTSGQIPASFHRRMPEHDDPALRAWAAGYWLWLTPGQRDALLADPDPAVRDAARAQSRVLDPEAMAADLPAVDCHHRGLLLTNYAVSDAVAEKCLAEERNLWALAHNQHTPAHAVARLARHPDPEIRARVASRADLDPALLAELAEDPEDAVRTRALVHPLPRTWAQRAAIDRIVGRTAEEIGPVPEMLVEPDTDWYSACAVSEHPLLRRVAATCPRLPEELVNRLADDPDPHVRHLLAYNHPLAPPRTLLDAFIATPRRRSHLLTLPGLPRTGLARFLAHDDPGVRALAAADPTLDRPPLPLLTDPEPQVRNAAAASPLLPPELIPQLLDAPGTAEGAAANPSLSPERLHDLLDLAGLPRPTARPDGVHE